MLNPTALYDPAGEYRYTGGWSLVALTAFVVAVLPNVPGFLVQVQLLDAAHLPAGLLGLYSYAWFVGFGIAFVVYLGLRRLAPRF
jgi:NCS1 family nucleobase:cation symporter-1